MSDDLPKPQGLDLLQNLVMTPEIQKAIRLLGTSGRELLAVVRAEVEANPALEIDACPEPSPPIQPEVTVERTGISLQVVLRNVLPPVRITPEFAASLSANPRAGDEESKRRVAQAQRARWFLASLERRRETVETVVRDVVEHHQAFFDGELGPLRPLFPSEVAMWTEMHVRTVLQVVKSQEIRTCQGDFLLGYFFSRVS